MKLQQIPGSPWDRHQYASAFLHATRSDFLTDGNLNGGHVPDLFPGGKRMGRWRLSIAA